LLQAKISFLSLARGTRMQTVLLQGIGGEQEKRRLLNRISRALDSISGQAVRFATAMPAEKFEASLAKEQGWRQVVLTPLFGSGDELLAILGLVDCRRDSPADVGLIQAMAMHAAAALQNSQLFARITRSSRQWAEIFDSISDFMLLHDEHQRVVRVNRSLSDKLKKEPADLLGVLVRDLLALPSNTPACPFCLDLRGEEFREEFRDPRTGSVYLVSSSHLRGGVEEGQQIVHVMKDVSASQRAERLYRDLFDNIQEGAYFSTPDGRLIEVNNALVRMLGYDSREELLAVQSEKLYVDPEHREESKRALHQFGRLRNHEAALLRRDGSIIYVLENSFVIRDEAAQVVEYRGVLLDITEMKHVQSQLLREHDFNTQILNHTQSLIAVVDTAGLVSYANRRCCEIATGGEGDLVGLRLETIVAGSHCHLLRAALQSALDGTPVSNIELPLVRGRENIGSFSVNLSPMRNSAGEVNSIVVVMTDITDVAVLQAKLMHAEKMAAVGQLVSGVAHEVNNPLTAILGFADLLLENPETSMEAKDDLQVIVQEAQRTREIVQNLLSFARQTPPEKQPVDVNQVLRRTISLRSYDLNNHGIELHERLDPELPQIIGDAHQLQQVFLNILNNACDAVRETGRRGKIVVATEKVAGSIELRFCDNGTGVSNPERIFDPFYTTKDVGKGTGLGLSICYGIVREHGGEILCFNNQDSPGATFCVRLPLIQHTARRILARAAGI
jgi:two-component system NtrC family sensor kinase